MLFYINTCIYMHCVRIIPKGKSLFIASPRHLIDKFPHVYVWLIITYISSLYSTWYFLSSAFSVSFLNLRYCSLSFVTSLALEPAGKLSPFSSSLLCFSRVTVNSLAFFNKLVSFSLVLKKNEKHKKIEKILLELWIYKIIHY